MSLEDLRKKIDDTDNNIVRLIAERIRIAEEIGGEKKKLGKQIEDTSREQVVLKHVREAAAQGKINQDAVEQIYKKIIALTKSAEGTVIAFQGEPGAYSEEAAFQYFGPGVHVKPCESFDDVFKAVEEGSAGTGIVPTENSVEGSIGRTQEMLLESKLKICGETELRVIHCLIANPGVKLDAVKKVYSHPQALGQCQAFLKRMNLEAVPFYDTAGSVKMVKEQGIKDGAAIASARAAEIYGMQVLARGIEDNQTNTTRFFIIGKQDAAPTGNDKTSIIFSVKDKPGSLYEFLKTLALKNINLTKIESRPTRQKPWEYNFYLDFEGHREDKGVKETLAELEKSTIFIKVLGSYPKAR